MSTTVDNSNVLRVIAIATLTDVQDTRVYSEYERCNKHSIGYSYLCKITSLPEGSVEYNKLRANDYLALTCKAELLNDSEVELLSNAKQHDCFKTTNGFKRGLKNVLVELIFDNGVLTVRRYVNTPLEVAVLRSKEVCSKYKSLSDIFDNLNRVLMSSEIKRGCLFTRLSDFE